MGADRTWGRISTEFGAGSPKLGRVRPRPRRTRPGVADLDRVWADAGPKNRGRFGPTSDRVLGLARRGTLRAPEVALRSIVCPKIASAKVDIVLPDLFASSVRLAPCSAAPPPSAPTPSQRPATGTRSELPLDGRVACAQHGVGHRPPYAKHTCGDRNSDTASSSVGTQASEGGYPPQARLRINPSTPRIGFETTCVGSWPEFVDVAGSAWTCDVCQINVVGGHVGRFMCGFVMCQACDARIKPGLAAESSAASDDDDAINEDDDDDAKMTTSLAPATPWPDPFLLSCCSPPHRLTGGSSTERCVPEQHVEAGWRRS